MMFVLVGITYTRTSLQGVVGAAGMGTLRGVLEMPGDWSLAPIPGAVACHVIVIQWSRSGNYLCPFRSFPGRAPRGFFGT